MTDLQGLITNARFLLSNSPKRKAVFDLINGKNSTKDIAKKVNRSLSSVLHDIEKLRDFELIREKKSNTEKILKKDNAVMFEKTPLIKHVPNTYFKSISNTKLLKKSSTSSQRTTKLSSSIHIPNENEILDICRNGENQNYEFKEPGVETEKITREIAGFLHTKNGGVIFYGVADDGIIIGSDIRRQEMDQKIHNSIRYTLSHHPNIIINEKNVLGVKIILIAVPPWDTKTLYQYTKDGRYYIRRGTNVFALKSEEMQKLSKGQYII